ncbi:CDP-glucose 4,6-dehydratase [Methylocapsa palsarum]|uniref:CDP-glucose 4,6-dehydratase n=1 Tax=Methylocapsa palsarum TaxID=1612308 RepID=A0A1I3WRK1_9HYPH|nr:CDP-glucose 4,6-dehydratase [Methylocapsa palsarum]SFK09487.1 CDP-glucose 4,6-dehydratase [Methylocapsa palsarum]
MTPGFWKDRSVLVTGHTGFKGTWLSLWLERMGARITGLALDPEPGKAIYRMVTSGADSIIGDIRDLETVKRAMRRSKPDVVFHLAAQALVQRSYRDPLGTYATNVMGTAHVLEAIREMPSVAAAVIVTSDKCYENRNWHWGYRETEPMGGRDPYSNSKACSELVAAAYRSSFFEGGARSCAIATARSGNVIGGGDWSEDRLVPDMIRSFDAGDAVEIRSPEATRPWQHVLEPLSGYILLAEALSRRNSASFAEAWNFGPRDEDCVPVRALVGQLAARWGEGASWRIRDHSLPHEAHYLKIDASKAKTRLGWFPRLRLDEAIEWTSDWYSIARSQGDMTAFTAGQIARYEAIGGRPTL